MLMLMIQFVNNKTTYIKSLFQYLLQFLHGIECLRYSFNKKFKPPLSGNVKTFIRDCTDGNAFLDDEIDAPFKNNVVPNNKTTCHYIGTGFIACVTVCDPRTDGDFCNGPVTDSTTQCVPNIALLMSLIFAIFLCRNKLQ